MTNESDINDLQMRVAHQDQQIQELNDVVIIQGKEIDALKKHIQMTKSKLTEIENNMSDLGQEAGLSAIDEAAANKPPHY